MTDVPVSTSQAIPNTSVASQNESARTPLPSIKDLLHTSWETFTARVYQMFVLSVVMFGLGAAVIIGSLVLILLSGIGTFVLPFIQTQDPSVLQNVLASPFFWIMAVVAFLFVTLSMILLSAAHQIALIFIIGDSGETQALPALKKSIPLIVPVAVVQFFTGLFVAGGFFLFIIPGIIFSMFFSFVLYEAVLNGKKGMDALKRSAYLVSLHFGDIIVRWFVVIGIYIGLMVIPAIIEEVAPETKNILSFLSIFINTLAGWFSAVYWVTVYKQISAGKKKDIGKPLTWFTVVAVTGWVLGILMFAGVIALGISLAGDERFGSEIEKYKNQMDVDENLKTFDDRFTTPEELNRQLEHGMDTYDPWNINNSSPSEVPPAY